MDGSLFYISLKKRRSYIAPETRVSRCEKSRSYFLASPTVTRCHTQPQYLVRYSPIKHRPNSHSLSVGPRWWESLSPSEIACLTGHRIQKNAESWVTAQNLHRKRKRRRGDFQNSVSGTLRIFMATLVRRVRMMEKFLHLMRASGVKLFGT